MAMLRKGTSKFLESEEDDTFCPSNSLVEPFGVHPDVAALATERAGAFIVGKYYCRRRFVCLYFVIQLTGRTGVEKINPFYEYFFCG